MTGAVRPLDHVKSPVTDARIEQQWSAIEAAGLPGVPRARSRFRWIWGVSAFATAALAIAAWSSIRGGAASSGTAPALRGGAVIGRPARVPDGALVMSAQEPIGVRLEDGSRLQLSPRSRMQLIKNEPTAIELDLRAGRVHFDVTHAKQRNFRVRAGLLEVRVVGTRFDVERTAQAGASRVQVTVLEGTVEVRRRDQPQGSAELRRLHAGESWSALLANEPHAQPADAKNADDAADAEPAGAEASDEIEEPATEEAAEPSGGETRPRESIASDAARVFKRASLARRAGRMREAADGYAELLAHHPNDGRAGVSAFELGRIRMDALGDAAGAIDALERALERASGSSFHEDAMARIVVANDALGRTDACRRARDRYQARYPEGVHLRALALRCR